MSKILGFVFKVIQNQKKSNAFIHLPIFINNKQTSSTDKAYILPN